MAAQPWRLSGVLVDHVAPPPPSSTPIVQRGGGGGRAPQPRGGAASNTYDAKRECLLAVVG